MSDDFRITPIVRSDAPRDAADLRDRARAMLRARIRQILSERFSRRWFGDSHADSSDQR